PPAIYTLPLHDALPISVDRLPHVAAWREAYRAFGARPGRTRNSLEALTRRAPSGLPRVNRLTDIYNAVSVLHQVPVGGEDLDRQAGPPPPARATAGEALATVAHGAGVGRRAGPGAGVRRAGAGRTCRRWNWRQGTRPQLRDDTRTALFVLDALGPMTDAALLAAADEIVAHLATAGADLTVHRRLLAP